METISDQKKNGESKDQNRQETELKHLHIIILNEQIRIVKYEYVL